MAREWVLFEGKLFSSPWTSPDPLPSLPLTSWVSWLLPSPLCLSVTGNATQDGGLLRDQNSRPLTSRLSPPSCLVTRGQSQAAENTGLCFLSGRLACAWSEFSDTPEGPFCVAPRLGIMPGVPTPDMEERQEVSADGSEDPALQGTPRQILEQRVAEAKRVVSLLVSTIGHLRQEAATLRAEQQHLREHMEKLRQFLKQEKEPSTAIQTPEDLCEGTEMAKETPSHSPTSADTGKPSEMPVSSDCIPESPSAAGNSK